MMRRKLLHQTLRPVRQLLCSSTAVNNVSCHNFATRATSHSITITATNITPSIKQYNLKSIQSAAFSSDANSKQNTKDNKVGIVARVRNVIRTIFGSNDDTPRGIQERKDMYWILLAVTHRNLRMEAQQHHLQKKQQQNDNNDQFTSWSDETKEQIKQYMEEAVIHLDDQTDISEMSLRQLRQEIQIRLRPQISGMLNVACHVEEDMVLHHKSNVNVAENDDDESYEFTDAEAAEYKEVLFQEYDRICKLLANANESDASQYYEVKKGAIETLLQYFDWVPPNTTLSTEKPDIQTDEKDYADDFGFYPNRSEAEIVSAMRYYQARNIVRSHRVRTFTVNDDGSNTENSSESYTYSILPFKSTITNAGRGVFIDGFAPAGTLLSFFPGKVWPKEHLMNASLQTQMQFSENDPRNQLSMRYDDILIDSRQSPYTVVKNLWAAGHIVNHPPPPMKAMSTGETNESNNEEMKEENPHEGPNCVTVPINFTEGLFADQHHRLREFIPNEYELPPKSWAKDVFEKEKIVMHGLGLIALRDLEDEELFYDYRMSPNENAKGSEGLYPSWYHVWDADAASNRWSNDEE